MKILAVDTSTQTCSVALIDGENLIAETTTGSHQTHTKRLLGIIAHLLAGAGWRTAALDGMAVVQGPGSFTGLRIGISSIKGLAAATGKPVVGVSSLEALAWQCLTYKGRIYPLIDARKTEVYTAGFLAADGRLNPLMPQQVAGPNEVLANIEAPCLMVGNGALLYGDMIRERLGSRVHLAPLGQHHVRASTVAFLAWQRFKQGDLVEDGQLVPEYLRKSDAQIHLNAKKLS
jgi:tRNA threonylcarbamoyladenosine biosynthesis protein TsaB